MPRKTAPAAPLRPGEDGASMRPRPDAAENLCRARGSVTWIIRFNEAAARCRGKPPGSDPLTATAPAASMRPRPDAAENPLIVWHVELINNGFNEAAARCRGKPPVMSDHDLNMDLLQ